MMTLSSISHRSKRTLGFEDPANPAFKVDVPLSITTGWLRRRELEPSAAASSDAIVEICGCLFVVARVLLMIHSNDLLRESGRIQGRVAVFFD